MYGKLIDNKLSIAPINYIDENTTILNFNLNEDVMKEYGYKPVVEVERPETNRMYHIEYSETDNVIIESIVFDETQEEADEREAQAERERIGNLQVTKRVFMLALQQLGITYTQLKELIATNEQAQMEWDLCVELQRKNPLLDTMAAQLGISSEILDYIFKVANGEIQESED